MTQPPPSFLPFVLVLLVTRQPLPPSPFLSLSLATTAILLRQRDKKSRGFQAYPAKKQPNSLCPPLLTPYPNRAMPQFGLVLSVEEQENVDSIAAAAGRTWALKIRCTECNETTKSFIFVDAQEVVETDGGGVRHCAFKCAFCKGTITVDVLPNNSASDGYTVPLDVASASAAGRDLSGVVVSFDIRGGEPEELRLDDEWNVVSLGGEVFEGVDLSADWCEFDEKAGVPVALSGVSASFVKSKAKK